MKQEVAMCQSDLSMNFMFLFTLLEAKDEGLIDDFWRFLLHLVLDKRESVGLGTLLAVSANVPNLLSFLASTSCKRVFEISIY